MRQNFGASWWVCGGIKIAAKRLKISPAGIIQKDQDDVEGQVFLFFFCYTLSTGSSLNKVQDNFLIFTMKD